MLSLLVSRICRRSLEYFTGRGNYPGVPRAGCVGARSASVGAWHQIDAVGRPAILIAGDRPYIHAGRADALIQQKSAYREGARERQPSGAGDVLVIAGRISQELNTLLLMLAEPPCNLHELVFHRSCELDSACLKAELQLFGRRGLRQGGLLFL